ncbi:DUF4194 domain-containing protein [Microbispora bryophytorum]|uniref:DUF4194 domain-containing protein n=1 Tax=Microbispora bryophytorum TaxID=1460882 RepID=UPI00371DA7D6
MAKSKIPISFADVFDEPEPSVDALLDLDELFDDSGASVGALVDPGSRQPRFDGDTSKLHAEVCWALQELVAAPHVSEKSKKHWAVILQYEDVLRSRLSELGLILEINREAGYAFTQQASDPSPHSRTILRARTLSLAASALSLYLYNQYILAPDEPVVETDDMVEHMQAYQRPDDTDDAGFQRKIRRAIETLDEVSIIKPVKGTDRYIIYPVIASILTAGRVEALRERYLALASGSDPGSAATDQPDDHTDDPEAEAVGQHSGRKSQHG